LVQHSKKGLKIGLSVGTKGVLDAGFGQWHCFAILPAEVMDYFSGNRLFDPNWKRFNRRLAKAGWNQDTEGEAAEGRPEDFEHKYVTVRIRQL
jgi:hypothetical protein